MFKRQIVLIAVGVLTRFTLLVSRPWRSSIVYRRLLVIILGPVPVHFAVALNGVDRFPLVPRRLSVAAYRAGLVIKAKFLPLVFSPTNGALTKNCNYGSFPVFEILRIISRMNDDLPSFLQHILYCSFKTDSLPFYLRIYFRSTLTPLISLILS